MKQSYDRRRNRHCTLIRQLSALVLLLSSNNVHCQTDYYEDSSHMWPSESQESPLSPVATTTRLTSLDVICGKEYMTVRAEFNAPFNGIVFSKGTYGQSKCVYVKQHSGLTHTSFNVRYDECGTKPDLQGKYFENTIVIQYGTDIIEALDEAKRLRCEWFEAYEKPATFRPAIPVADLDIIEMNFQGDEIDCWMSIQEGKGPSSSEISRIVTVGQPLSIVVAINDYKNQFDMKVKSCFAHDGVKSPIYLIDEDGCVLRPKMISPFKKIRNMKGKASLISYAQFLAFKFPDSVDVQIQCTVEVCRHGCADTCDTSDKYRPNNKKISAVTTEPNNNNIYKNINVKLNRDNNVNHFFVENSDLLESANTNEQVTNKPQQNEEDAILSALINDHLRKDNTNTDKVIHEINSDRQTELNDIVNFLQNVDHKEFSKTNSTNQRVLPSANNQAIGDNQNLFDSVKMNVPYGNRNKMPMHRPQRPLKIPVNSHYRGPVAQVMNIPISPMYVPSQQPMPAPTIFNPFNNIKLFNSISKKTPSIPQLFSNYFGKNRRSQYVPNDNFEYANRYLPYGQRSYRNKRFINDKQGEIGLKRGFQVVTSLDLSFLPNMSTDQMQIYEGKPAPIVYGLCFPTTHFLFAITLILVLLVTGIASCICIIYKLERPKRCQ